jgi:uncharacterized membrane protein
LSNEIGVLSEIEDKALSDLDKERFTAIQIEEETGTRTFDEFVADRVVDFGGSWRFKILFGVFMILWILSTIYLLDNKGFDPFPFILLNLILSCLAALQPPVIIMSQNRQEE